MNTKQIIAKQDELIYMLQRFKKWVLKHTPEIEESERGKDYLSAILTRESELATLKQQIGEDTKELTISEIRDRVITGSYSITHEGMKEDAHGWEHYARRLEEMVSKGMFDHSASTTMSKDEEFHVWVIPEESQIFVTDRDHLPAYATEHIVFDNWDGAVKLGHFLAKICGYYLELDNEAGRFAEDEIKSEE